MFCPKCKAEYVEGVDKCDDCDATLVDKLTEIAEEDKKRFDQDDFSDTTLSSREPVAVFSGNQAQVAVAKSLLMDAGIKYSTRNEFLFGLYGSAFGFEEIVVRAEDEVEARTLLSDLTK